MDEANETVGLIDSGRNTRILQYLSIGTINFNANQFYTDRSAGQRVLPVALLAALAMTSTAATEYFAYATLLCQDPSHCNGHETSNYAGFIGGATCIANILGLAALGDLQKLAITHRKRGLQLWMVLRSLSAVMLLVGISLGSIYAALFGRVFEGLASDNLLHFTLNTVYAQAPGSKDQASSLISYSLALYMAGIAVGPFAGGLFSDFLISFFVAIGLFAVCIAYLQLCVASIPTGAPKWNQLNQRCSVISNGGDPSLNREIYSGGPGAISKWLKTFLSPLTPFRNQPRHIFIGFGLFAYNVVQSYVFTSLLVYSSFQFGFTARENGFLISLAHVVAASYIFINIYAVPRIFRFLHGLRTALTESGPQHIPFGTIPTKRDAISALVSLSIQVLSLTALAFTTQPWQVYLFTACLALSLPTSSFIKAHYVNLFEGNDRPMALVALALVEMLGSVLGPLVLGGLQSYVAGDGRVFLVAAVIGTSSMVSLSISLWTAP